MRQLLADLAGEDVIASSTRILQVRITSNRQVIVVQTLRIRMEETLVLSKLVRIMITPDHHHLRSSPITLHNRLHTLHLMIHIIGDRVLAKPHKVVSELLQAKINFSHQRWRQRRTFTITATTRKNLTRPFARVGQGLQARNTNHPLNIITKIPVMLLRRCRHLMVRTIDRQASYKREGSRWQGHGEISEAEKFVYIVPFAGIRDYEFFAWICASQSHLYQMSC